MQKDIKAPTYGVLCLEATREIRHLSLKILAKGLNRRKGVIVGAGVLVAREGEMVVLFGC